MLEEVRPTQISFHACRDFELVKRVLTQDERVYRAIHDDDAPTPEAFECVDHPSVGYVLIRDENDEILGVAIIMRHSLVQYEVHNAILPRPGVGWKKRIEIGKAFFEWIWAAGRCRRIIGKVVGSNRYAMRYNEALGMDVFGVNRNAFMKDKRLQDEIWFGISRPEDA